MIHNLFKLFGSAGNHVAKHAVKRLPQITAKPWLNNSHVHKHTLNFLAKVAQFGFKIRKNG